MPESWIQAYKDISWKSNSFWLHCIGSQAASHQFTAGINSILFRHWAYQDWFPSLDDWWPVVLPDCLWASKGGGNAIFLSVWTSKKTFGSYLHFPSLYGGGPPGMADLIMPMLSVCYFWSYCCIVDIKAAQWHACRLPLPVNSHPLTSST